MCSKCFIANGGVLPKPSDKKENEVKWNPNKHWKKKLRSACIKVKAILYFLSGKRPEQIHKDRCWQCQRKLGLSGIQCRCGYIFCGKHRYSDEHECKYDHQQRHRLNIAKANQKIEGKKLDKIEDD
jgi:hypothetical protein